MSQDRSPETPRHRHYDVVIIGGAMMGAATAWFLSQRPDFDGRILVVERDPSFENSSTMHSNSCIRQQFSTEINVRISQFTADFIGSLQEHMRDRRAPNLTVQNFGYLYLASDPAFAEHLRQVQAVQIAAGAGTRLLSPAQIAEAYPFYVLDDILLGSLNTENEGYWDSGTLFDWFRRSARQRGAETLTAEVVAIRRNGARVTGVSLANGAQLSCDWVVNATGPRAARTAAMAGLDLPVEPRKRFTWVISAERPLDRDLPLTIDPSGVHVRQDGPATYMVGARPDPDPAVDPDDFTMDHAIWQDHVWPTIATRIPQFEAIRVVSEWAGHYAYNTVDQNAVLGPHPDVENFLFINGFSGHGLQQAPAMGRGLAEWICTGGYQSLDLTPFAFDRLVSGTSDREHAVI